MVDAEDGTFQLRPKALNGVGVFVAVHELFCSVIDNSMAVFAFNERVVADVLICIDARAFLNKLSDDGHQSSAFGVLRLQCDNVAVSLGHSENWGLGL